MKFKVVEELLREEVDSLGNELSQDQVSFFKNSKIRDKKGNLLVCYHGTQNKQFGVFDPRVAKSQFGEYKFGRKNVNFFTTSKDVAIGYTNIGIEENGNVYACYLNIVNPFIVNNEHVEDIVPRTWSNIKDKRIRDRQISLFDKFWKKWKYADDEEYVDDINDDIKVFNVSIEKNDNGYYTVYKGEESTKYGRKTPILYDYTIEELFDNDMYDEWREKIIGEDEEDYRLTTNDIVRYVLDLNRDGEDYDGIIIPKIMDIGPQGSPLTMPADTIITLDGSSQIKAITNKTPTHRDNINESVEIVDSEGNRLSKEQLEFFKDSKIKGSSGKLMVCYHASNSNFDVFDKSKIGSGNGGANFGYGFYFATYKDLANEYGDNIKEYYLNVKNPYIYNWDLDHIKDLIDKSNMGYDATILDDEKYEQLWWDGDIIDDIIAAVVHKGENPYAVFTEMVKKCGYDGIIVDWDEIIVFEPNQIKSVDNKNPTNKDNINEDLQYIDDNRSKATTKDGREFTIWTEVEDSHDGQLDKLKIAYVGDDWMDENDKVIVDNLLGYVDYSVYNNSAYINFIKVKDSERRKGVGTALIKSLEHDHDNVNWGYTTDEGELLRKSIKGE